MAQCDNAKYNWVGVDALFTFNNPDSKMFKAI